MDEEEEVGCDAACDVVACEDEASTTERPHRAKIGFARVAQGAIIQGLPLAPRCITL